MTHANHTGARPPVVRIDAAPIGVDEIVAIANGARVELGPIAEARIAAGRAVVEEYLAGPEPVYGLNTGLGHARDERLAPETLRHVQELTVRMHDGGTGAPLPVEIVRAAMATRIAGVALGGSGVTVQLARTLVAMLNAGIHPVVPSNGSVGASDLMHMGAIAQVAIGFGVAEFGGQRLSGAEAMRRAGIPVLGLEPKEGLAILSANGVSVGHGALVVERAARLAAAADVVAALSLEAIHGNPSILEASVAVAKPVPGQIAVAAHMRALLRGGSILDPGAAASVQDPLSFRVVPQVHGAFREVLGFTRSAVDGELAAMDDNPLVVVAERRMISNGNFHPMLLALAFDGLRPAIAHVGQISDRRMNHLWSRLFSAGGSPLIDALELMAEPGAGVMPRYAAAARYAELRGMAGPATLDIAPLDLGQEDHATAATITVQRTSEALDALEEILVVELLLARDVVRFAGMSMRHGAGAAAALDAVADACTSFGPATMTADIVAALRPLLSTTILAAADGAAG
ncbi:MAG: aromatic amino acid lyase [Candidatus Limnocylindrales bacterium]